MSTNNVEDLSQKDAGFVETATIGVDTGAGTGEGNIMPTVADEETALSEMEICRDRDEVEYTGNTKEVDGISLVANDYSSASADVVKPSVIGSNTGTGFDTEKGNNMHTEVDEEAALSGKGIGQDGDEVEYNEIPNTKGIGEISRDANAASKRDAEKAAHGALGLESLKITRNGQELGITEAAYIIANAILADGDLAHKKSKGGTDKGDTITSVNHATKLPVCMKETNIANDGVTASANYHESKSDPSGSSFNGGNLSGDVVEEPLGNPYGNTSGKPFTNPGEEDPVEGPNEVLFGDFIDESKWNPNAIEDSIPSRDLTYKKLREVAKVKETMYYPEDCYSFIALNGPDSNGVWPKQNMLLFAFGMFPFFFQIMFLLLLLSSVISEKRGTLGENDNPDGDKEGFKAFFAAFIPSNAPPVLRCTQVLSILSYLLFRNSTVKDFVKAVELWPNSAKVIHGDPIHAIRFSCLLRGLQGAFAMIATLLLVGTSKEVVDVVLNFTAIGFVSELDDVAFDLAKGGDFGKIFRKESERVANEKLPFCMQREKDFRYVVNKMIIFSTGAMIFLSLIVIVICQQSTNLWVTRALRVQFLEPHLLEFGGCFTIDDSASFFKRRSYNSYDQGESKTSFIYCRDYRQWILFMGDLYSFDTDPCEVRDSDREIARSTKTDTFDISTAFEERWVSSSNAPLRLYFFEIGLEEEDLHCDLTLGDGVCDSSFNEFSYQWDIGDCCPATCNGFKCGRGLYELFGTPDVPGTDFPECLDPAMVPITIRLNEITSSRDPQFTSFPKEWFDRYGIDETDWRAETPVDPYFALNCNGKTVLSFYMEEEMKYNSKRLEIDDGAICSLEIRNNTRTKEPDPNDPPEPIWFVNYTIFHGDGDKQIEILSHHSSESATVNFTRMPECFFTELGSYIDETSIYTSFEPSNQAINWMVGDDPEKSFCEDEFFKERYALTSTYFAMNGTSKLINRERQCAWPSVICKDGQIITLTLEDLGLNEGIPTEIHLLPGLKKLKLARNNFTMIPTEINHMASLEELDLTLNKIVSIPTEIGRIVNLTELHLGQNQIESVPADIIGLMTSMEYLVLSGNTIASLPTEIGLMESLQKLILDANQKIPSLPREIGNLTNMKLLSLDANKISSLPTEIAMMTNLQEMTLFSNRLNFIPTELGKLTKMRRLELSFNSMISLPTELGLLNRLQGFNVGYNQITSLPTEIGLLTSTQSLTLSGNYISSLPPEIGLMTTVEEFYLNSNQVENLPTEIGLMTNLKKMNFLSNKISSIPTEFGLLKTLFQVIMRSNQITFLPSEIGLMTSLNELDLFNNQMRSLPTEIGTMANMVKLNLGINYISSLPTEIGMMTNVEELDFRSNQIISVPTEIGLLTSLQKHLIFVGNQISSIPTEIGLVTSLRELYFYNNYVKSIPSEIGQMSNLQRLYLHTNQISSVPSTLGLLENLQDLDLHDNAIGSISALIPEEIGFFSSLNRLRLNQNFITTIPTEIGLMTSLQHLDLSENYVTSIPTEVGLMANLQNLELFDNQISSIPRTIALLENLQELDMSNNVIDSFSAIVSMENGFFSSLNRLRLNKNSLPTFPTEVGLMTNLQHLDLSENYVTSIPTEIGQTSNLQTLLLFDNQISSVPETIGLLKNLQKLFLNNNQISSVPETIGLLTNLRHLLLYQNLFTTIPTEVGLMKNLQYLDLSENYVTSIPTEIGQTSNLQIVLLYQNLLTTIPTEVGLMTNLQYLDLSANYVISIPTEIGQTSNLQTLILYNNQISSVPETIGQLTNLQKLYLDNNQISSVPSTIGQLTNLQELYFNNNQILSVPSTIGQLINLQELYLNNNQILSVPEAIGQLTNLQKLFLNNNQISSVPSTIGQLTNLQVLHLYNNQISSVPSTIGQLTNLQELYLINNQLSSIPTGIGNLSNLQILWLSDNQISSVPSTIGQLTNLRELHLYKNQITSLPTEIGLMTSLEIFSVYNNSIAWVPGEIGNLKSLQRLEIMSGNNITDDDLPEEVNELCNYIFCI